MDAPSHGIPALTSVRSAGDNHAYSAVSGFSRRDFVAALSAAIPLLAAPRWVFARSVTTRELRFTHSHTGERLAVEYFSGGSIPACSTFSMA